MTTELPKEKNSPVVRDDTARDYKDSAIEQKRRCEKGQHLHSVMTEGGYVLQSEKPEHPYDWECCPCFGCCVPALRKAVQ